MDAIDNVLLKSRMHFLGMAARTAEPVMKLAVLSCMDARIDVAALLGLRPGDAHVVRNAGGRATRDAINSLAISQAVLGTREVMVIHHTECAIGMMDQAQIAARIAAATKHPFSEQVGAFADPILAVLEDVERLRRSSSLAHRDKIRGFIFDLQKNALTEVLAPTSPVSGAPP